MDTLLTIGLCILAVLVEFAVVALIVAPKAVARWLRGLMRRMWSALTSALRGIGGAVRSGEDRGRSSVPE